MFERFTDRARRVIVVAQEIARENTHNYIAPEHLVAALVSFDDGTLYDIFRKLPDHTVERLRFETRKAVSELPASDSVSGHIPFTVTAKRAIELSLREALQLGHNYIGVEHLALAFFKMDTRGAEILTECGVTRQEIIKGLGEAFHAEPRKPTLADRYATLSQDFVKLQNENTRLKDRYEPEATTYVEQLRALKEAAKEDGLFLPALIDILIAHSEDTPSGGSN